MSEHKGRIAHNTTGLTLHMTGRSWRVWAQFNNFIAFFCLFVCLYHPATEINQIIGKYSVSAHLLGSVSIEHKSTITVETYK